MTIIEANKITVLYTLLEEYQSILDDLEHTPAYSKKLKQTAKMFASEVEKKLADWYKYTLAKGDMQEVYLRTAKDLSDATSALLTHSPASWKLIPHFLEALKNDQVQTYEE
jgi:hypothetical protein